jgi:hypothetical protein
VLRRIVYDNLTVAVKEIVGSERELTERFTALVSHYLFEPCFARPGEGYDKGGVEARGKGIRLAHLTPIPKCETLSEISEVLLREVELAFAGEQRFVEEHRHLRELPERQFQARKVELVSISRRSTMSIGGATYSVPSQWASLRATAYVGVEDIRLLCREQAVVYSKERKGKQRIRYRDYLSELAKKPQALSGWLPSSSARLASRTASSGRCSLNATGRKRPQGCSPAFSEQPWITARILSPEPCKPPSRGAGSTCSL